MLTINITPTALYFKDLSDELQEEIIEKFDLKFDYSRDKPCIKDKPEKLYKILYLLATRYDIELI